MQELAAEMGCLGPTGTSYSFGFFFPTRVRNASYSSYLRHEVNHMSTICGLPIQASKVILSSILGVALLASIAGANVAYAAEQAPGEIFEQDENVGFYTTIPSSEADAGLESTEDTRMSGSGELAQNFARCTFETGADNPHRSDGDVSAHGWWNETSEEDRTCPEYADVEVRLQAWWCDIFFNCWWVTQAIEESRVREGGGRGRRTTARQSCTRDGREVSWLNVVDVDLVGTWDRPFRAYKEIDIECYPD